MHYPLGLLNNPTKFKFNLIRTQHFQLKLFNVSATLKYGHGHRKWYEQVKFNEKYHHGKFDGVRVNPSVSFHQAQTHVDYLP